MNAELAWYSPDQIAAAQASVDSWNLAEVWGFGGIAVSWRL